MVIYFLLLFYIFIITNIFKFILIKKDDSLVFVYNNHSKKANFLQAILLVFPIIYVFLARELSKVGTDTMVIYHDIYYVGYGVENWSMSLYEYLFKVLIKLVYGFNDQYRLFLFICYLCITFIFSYVFFNNKTKIDITMAFLYTYIWIFIPSLNILRQILAISFGIIAIDFLKKGEIKKFFLVIVIDSFIHVSSILLLFYYIPYYLSKSLSPLKKCKNKKIKIRLYKFLPWIICLSPAFLGLFRRVIESISFISKYAGYLDDFKFSNINLKFFVVHLIVLMPIILKWKKMIKLDSFNYVHLCASAFIIFSIILSGFFPYAFRVMYYFVPSEIILLSQLSKTYSNEKNRKFVMVFYYLNAFFTFWFIYVFYDTDGVCPYVFDNTFRFIDMFT